MRYLILKSHFRFLIDKFYFRVELKRTIGFVMISYINSKIRIIVSGDDNIKIIVSDVNSLGTYYDAIEYSDEFYVNGNYCQKVAAAAAWVKTNLKNLENKIINS